MATATTLKDPAEPTEDIVARSREPKMEFRSGASNMLSNNFWYGFLMGAGLVLLIAFVSLLLARARAKNGANPVK
jgi:hypothetical protein